MISLLKSVHFLLFSVHLHWDKLSMYVLIVFCLTMVPDTLLGFIFNQSKHVICFARCRQIIG